MSGRIFTELDYTIGDTPKVIGTDAINQFKKVFAYMYATHNPFALTGDPGTGKTFVGREIDKHYARMVTKRRIEEARQRRDITDDEAQAMLDGEMAFANPCRAFYVQCDSETMRTNLIGGVVFVEGSEKSVLAVVAYAMAYGHAVFVDEFTHAMPSIQTVLNSVMDSEAIIAVGDILVRRHQDFRIFIGHNRTKHAGNFPIKPSTASRLRTFPFEYPEGLTEAKIAYNISELSIGKHNIKPPASVYKFLVSWCREIRHETKNQLPISARNVAAMCDGMSLASLKKNAEWPVAWKAGSSATSIRETVAKRVMFIFDFEIDENNPNDPHLKRLQNDGDLHAAEIKEVLDFFASVGREEVIDIVLECSMYHSDVDGINPRAMERYQQYMRGSII